MLRYQLLLTLLTLAVCGHAQKIAELDRRNGFKDIKLCMAIDSLKGYKLKKEFKEQDEFDARLYEIDNPEYASIGEVEVNRVEVKTYKDQIYQIHIVTEKDPRLMKALESIYGLAEYDHKRETYFWRTKSLVLKFRSFSKNQLEMIYTSFRVFDEMKTDKRQKVNDIANDF